MAPASPGVGGWTTPARVDVACRGVAVAGMRGAPRVAPATSSWRRVRRGFWPTRWASGCECWVAG